MLFVCFTCCWIDVHTVGAFFIHMFNMFDDATNILIVECCLFVSLVVGLMFTQDVRFHSHFAHVL